MGGSPGLVVMGDESCSKGRGLESRRRILDGLTFFTLICCKNCIDVCLKRPKINEKRTGLANFLKKKNYNIGTVTLISNERP